MLEQGMYLFVVPVENGMEHLSFVKVTINYKLLC